MALGCWLFFGGGMGNIIVYIVADKSRNELLLLLITKNPSLTPLPGYIILNQPMWYEDHLVPWILDIHRKIATFIEQIMKYLFRKKHISRINGYNMCNEVFIIANWRSQTIRGHRITTLSFINQVSTISFFFYFIFELWHKINSDNFCKSLSNIWLNELWPVN